MLEHRSSFASEHTNVILFTFNEVLSAILADEIQALTRSSIRVGCIGPRLAMEGELPCQEV